MVKTIIFDFDGTIADTLVTIAKISNKFAAKYGYKKFTDENVYEIRDLTIKEIFKKLDAPLYKSPFIGYDVKKELNKHIEDIKPIKGMEQVLKELKKKNYKLGILTSNNKNNVKLFLEKNELDFFDYISTGTTLFGKAKVIQRFLQNYTFNRQEVIYVGDEIRDIEATRKVGIPIIACTWGLNSKKALEKAKPDFLIDDPKELIAVLEAH